ACSLTPRHVLFPRNTLAGVSHFIQRSAEAVILVLELGAEFLPVEFTVLGNAASLDLANPRQSLGSVPYALGPFFGIGNIGANKECHERGCVYSYVRGCRAVVATRPDSFRLGC